MKLTKSQLKKIIKEQVSVLKENVNPIFNAQTKRKANNIVAAIYFAWVKQDNNNSTFWNNAIKIIEDQDCVVLHYVVTDSVCEFEFKPSTPAGQDELEYASNRVEEALGLLSGKFTKYDVYIVGN
jgi:hypothetical protein